MTFNDMLDSGIEFQSEVRLCYYDDNKEERIIADCVKNSALYESCCNEEIKYIVLRKEFKLNVSPRGLCT